ncbi:5-carboxymethyl-2-hydroxymuconate Delta-isomerase [Pseudoalteromonas sp. McH1-7]|uniref:5-carboxymethyl-2-hydroxymuconate isomerase n=1 Tax=Pseudoalteromonas peptidolytica F12-50-A1 TaxID=1315280 RepID=A0A8I0T4D6_9GAMM|nr:MULTISPECIES: 5-carboxymethyl-2-hydroxymuconate Delta-isomerase [Pseudoalteromonas]MBE0345109.1 5-carboxymethyl-2-hydroxymuconate isomerase [Pseudoalteromonas peptidolytica F12-50-A1]MDW7550304.1 5-carboxymethyl-2-hydroxymuconate Delta-isomerase [Pseudoalteromonas peptidolytica]NLR14894.1 5-carboxymethyl-2-hydroxymuconate Delta-isomerase [Pseudoalteromonas peptidolytica]NUZ10789.1 5-carboxymethyl-2-hydroxymuconate Delta-isomerase [Pseudoalteromonas sp. McH1-7]RRS08907.1 5-carboxymethyl-2-hy
MPHFILEHSDNLPIETEALVSQVQQFACACGLFDPASVKTRAMSFEHFQLGDGKQGFIHLQIHLMAGRTIEQKQALTEGALTLLQAKVSKQFALSVHCYDLLPEIYRKN